MEDLQFDAMLSHPFQDKQPLTINGQVVYILYNVFQLEAWLAAQVEIFESIPFY